MVDRISEQIRNKLLNIFRSSESVHPRKIFCLSFEQMSVWIDDVPKNQSLTEPSHIELVVIERIERIKRGANYSIEFPSNMRMSVTPDHQTFEESLLYTSWVQSHRHATVSKMLERR